MNRLTVKFDFALSRPRAVFAFTMVELVVSISIMSLLLVAIGSSMVIASKALPSKNNPNDFVRQGANVVARIASDLRYANSFSDCERASITFSVADRDKNLLPEIIHYFWSGVLGDPLTRQYNGGVPITVVENIHQFSLVYDTKIATESISTQVASDEIVLINHPIAYSSSIRGIYGGAGVGQYFEPILPPDAISWNVTRVEVLTRPESEMDGMTSIQLRTADVRNMPTTTILEEHAMYESWLSPLELTWKPITFSNVSGRIPGTGLCMVLKWPSGLVSAVMHVDSGGENGLLTMHNGRGFWASADSMSMLYKVYGQYQTTGMLLRVDRTYLTSVGIRLQVGANFDNSVFSSSAILNAPEVTKP